MLDHSELAPACGVQGVGYVLLDAPGTPDVILIRIGSEIHIAIEAAMLLHEHGVAAGVVSLPYRELFDAQPAEYQKSVLPPEATARVSIETALTLGWERYVGI